ncbi:putative Adenylate cyclase [Paratrimastix pyriformis]|uniref:Adenylate cyclase n=1 Tax=Paratrimastix pyriformis TaxID=342808 RepID=A0ABQ8UR01_9EUKA|nr:putative Adenylate cyclase [Paratrimastix pyriformis]
MPLFLICTLLFVCVVSVVLLWVIWDQSGKISRYSILLRTIDITLQTNFARLQFELTKPLHLSSYLALMDGNSERTKPDAFILEALSLLKTYPNLGFVGFANTTGHIVGIRQLNQSSMELLLSGPTGAGEDVNIYSIDPESGRILGLIRSRAFDPRQELWYMIGRRSAEPIYVPITPAHLTQQLTEKCFGDTIALPANSSHNELVRTSARIALETYGSYLNIPVAPQSGQLHMTINGTRYHVRAMRILVVPGIDWILILAIPPTPAEIHYSRLRTVAIVLSGAAVFLTLLGGLAVAKIIRDSLSDLRRQLQFVTRQSPGPPHPPIPPPELGGDPAAAGAAPPVRRRWGKPCFPIKIRFREVVETEAIISLLQRAVTLMYRYLPPTLARLLMEQPATQPILAGMEERRLTVLFVDIQRFTALAEKLSPEELFQVLNSILGAVSAVVNQHQGTIDKFMGDAVMVFWNAPFPQEHHERLACECALDIVEAIKNLPRPPDVPPLRVRVGIHTGQSLVGNVGAQPLRMDYTVLSDTVNCASRLEDFNRVLGTCILISEEVARAVPDMHIRPLGKGGDVSRARLDHRGFICIFFSFCGDVCAYFKNRRQGMPIFELVGASLAAASPEERRLTELQQALIGALRGSDFRRAVDLAEEIEEEWPHYLPARLQARNARRRLQAALERERRGPTAGATPTIQLGPATAAAAGAAVEGAEIPDDGLKKYNFGDLNSRGVPAASAGKPSQLAMSGSVYFTRADPRGVIKAKKQIDERRIAIASDLSEDPHQFLKIEGKRMKVYLDTTAYQSQQDENAMVRWQPDTLIDRFDVRLLVSSLPERRAPKVPRDRKLEGWIHYEAYRCVVEHLRDKLSEVQALEHVQKLDQKGQHSNKNTLPPIKIPSEATGPTYAAVGFNYGTNLPVPAPSRGDESAGTHEQPGEGSSEVHALPGVVLVIPAVYDTRDGWLMEVVIPELIAGAPEELSGETLDAVAKQFGIPRFNIMCAIDPFKEPIVEPTIAKPRPWQQASRRERAHLMEVDRILRYRRERQARHGPGHQMTDDDYLPEYQLSSDEDEDEAQDSPATSDHGPSKAPAPVAGSSRPRRGDELFLLPGRAAPAAAARGQLDEPDPADDPAPTTGGLVLPPGCGLSLQDEPPAPVGLVLPPGCGGGPSATASARTGPAPIMRPFPAGPRRIAIARPDEDPAGWEPDEEPPRPTPSGSATRLLPPRPSLATCDAEDAPSTCAAPAGPPRRTAPAPSGPASPEEVGMPLGSHGPPAGSCLTVDLFREPGEPLSRAAFAKRVDAACNRRPAAAGPATEQLTPGEGQTASVGGAGQQKPTGEGEEDEEEAAAGPSLEELAARRRRRIQERLAQVLGTFPTSSSPSQPQPQVAFYAYSSGTRHHASRLNAPAIHSLKHLHLLS